MSETIEDLIQAAINKDYTAAQDIFGDVMDEKMADAIEQEKVAVANSIYNGVEEEEIDDEDLELDDEDVEIDDNLDEEDGDLED